VLVTIRSCSNIRSYSLQVGDALFVDLPRIRLDGGPRALRARWGCDLGTLEEDEDCSGVHLNADDAVQATSPLGKSYSTPC